MTEPLLGDLGMHPSKQKLCRVAVAKIVKPDPRKVFHASNEPGELVRQAARLHRLVVRTGAQQRVTGLTDPERKKFLGLLVSQPARFLDSETRKGDRFANDHSLNGNRLV